MYRSFEAAQELSPFVECYWSWQVSTSDWFLDGILPDAAPELILHFGAVPFVMNEKGHWQQQHREFLYCAAHKVLQLSVREPMRLFAIRFRPWGVSRFSVGPVTEILDRPVRPDQILGQLGSRLIAGLRAVKSNSRRVKVANEILGHALRVPSRNDKRLRKLLLASNGGRCTSSEMAKTLSISNRSFSRLWSDVVGIQPRHFLQLMRFHNALAMIDEGDQLKKVAAECDYSDQAHMARQIKSISGLTPSSLRRRLGNKVYRNLYASRTSAPWQIHS